ncbi:MAG: pyridoxal 5'-phosphate synthase glutaminase subunit PdxT [Clostridiales bacterium]|nr:pyridoxal 5'-phosphate synthase glutaminase subunit PdxT [Clostridiales bacterium]
MGKKKIAVLAVQGAFAEHIHRMEALGAECIELRQRADLEQEFDGLILPGGESTVQGKLLRELDLLAPLQQKIRNGLPVLGTCAGLILLAGELSNDEHTYFGTLPVRVQRNAYGRQLGSFHTLQEVKGIGSVPMTFIRAPYIESVQEAEEAQAVEILAVVDGHIVAVRYRNQLGIAFHPELDSDNRIHEMFLQMCRA